MYLSSNHLLMINQNKLLDAMNKHSHNLYGIDTPGQPQLRPLTMGGQCITREFITMSKHYRAGPTYILAIYSKLLE